MRSSLLLVTLLAASALLVAGCAQGPGHTRAAGTVGGTAAGALIGAAASPCNRAGGAAVGGVLGLVAGTLAGDAIASDQERAAGCPPPCPPPPAPVYYGPVAQPYPPPPGYYGYYGYYGHPYKRGWYRAQPRYRGYVYYGP